MTTGFSEAWLREYEAKRRTDVPAYPSLIRFTLAKAVKLPNVTLRMHFRARSKYAQALSSEIAKLTAHILMPAPFEHARVTIERFSIAKPDTDNLWGSVKALVDCLLPRSTRHPHGLGFVIDDSADCMVLHVEHRQVATLKAQGTTVTIEPISRSVLELDTPQQKTPPGRAGLSQNGTPDVV